MDPDLDLVGHQWKRLGLESIEELGEEFLDLLKRELGRFVVVDAER